MAGLSYRLRRQLANMRPPRDLEIRKSILGRVIPVTSKMVGSSGGQRPTSLELGLVGPLSLYCDYMK